MDLNINAPVYYCIPLYSYIFKNGLDGFFGNFRLSFLYRMLKSPSAKSIPALSYLLKCGDWGLNGDALNSG